MTRGQGLTCFVDMAKALLEISSRFSGPSGNEIQQMDIDAIQAILDRANIEVPRMQDALKAHGVEW